MKAQKTIEKLQKARREITSVERWLTFKERKRLLFIGANLRLLEDINCRSIRKWLVAMYYAVILTKKKDAEQNRIADEIITEVLREIRG